MAYSFQSLKSKCHHSREVPPGKFGNERGDISSQSPGISTDLPEARSYSVRSTAQPRLWREPFFGSATKIFPSAGVASQNIFVTYHGRYASWTNRPYPRGLSLWSTRTSASAAGRSRNARASEYTGVPRKLSARA